MARINYLLPLLLFLGIAFFLARGLKEDPSLIPSPLIGKPVPQFDRPRLLHTKQVVSNQLFMGRISLLNVWASWCYSCRAEHATLMDIAHSGKVTLYGLNYKDKRADATAWLQQAGNPYTADIYDPNGTLGINLGVYGTPETFLIDQQGVIRYKYIGSLTEDVWREDILPEIQKLEGGKTS